uniref:Uncharacterized protein n=1 Tax=Brassica campestris TaxID=3711 RepID=M4ENN3_BRACM
MSNSSLLLGDLKAAGVDVCLLRLCRLTDLLHGDDELLMPKEEVESLFDAYEDSDFRRSGSINGL